MKLFPTHSYPLSTFISIFPIVSETAVQTGSESEPTSAGGAGDNEVVFRHNIRLRAPACDCGESETFKSLLYRVNGLEEEVNYLKTQCAQGCCGSKGAGNRSSESQLFSVLAPRRCQNDLPARVSTAESLTGSCKSPKLN